MSLPRALLIGYGNPGRGDDGLGPAFAQRIADKALPGLSVEIDYQLMADHALMISQHDLVIFVDAIIGSDVPFVFTELTEIAPANMGSHSVTPEAAIALSQLLFQTTPRAFVLGIAADKVGEIAEGLCPAALGNLDVAEAFFISWYRDDQGLPA
ncbi:MAG: hydrogenase maturation protease [Paracoccaceae bacterium]|jgi:hydrogenase maturation protease